jgi:hypothetical protein
MKCSLRDVLEDILSLLAARATNRPVARSISEGYVIICPRLQRILKLQTSSFIAAHFYYGRIMCKKRTEGVMGVMESCAFVES